MTFKYALIFTVDKRKRHSAVSGVPFEMKVMLIFFILQINMKGEHITQRSVYIGNYLMWFVGRNMKRGTNKRKKYKIKRKEDER